MYDLDFIFSICGFADLPDYIQRERLFNVSFDIDSKEIKLYVLDKSERFLYKVSNKGITRQYVGNDPEYGGDPKLVDRLLGCQFNHQEVIIDAVENDNYYMYLVDASLEQKSLFINSLCKKFSISYSSFLEVLCLINGTRFATLDEALKKNAAPMVRVPFQGSNPKVYAQPRKFGGGLVMNDMTVDFLKRLYACHEEELEDKLNNMWIARELKTSRTVVVTQYHALLHSG